MGYWSGRKVLRIALYQCENLSQYLPASTPPSCSSYAALLQSAIDHVVSRCMPNSSLTLTTFDVTSQHYPTALSGHFDGVLISGSLSGVYDRKPWIRRLLQPMTFLVHARKEIQNLDKNKVKTCGISFGHQAIAAALGATVAPNPKGSEVSVREAELTDKARQLFNTTKRSFKLHYHHNDAILELPPDETNWWVLASNYVTRYQALYKAHHFLTFCGHPDYSHQPQALEQLLQLDAKMGWVAEKVVKEGIERVGEATDYEWILEQIISFYTGGIGISTASPSDGRDGSFVATP